MHSYVASFAHLDNISNVGCGFANLRWRDDQCRVRSKEDKIVVIVTHPVDLDLMADIGSNRTIGVPLVLLKVDLA